MTKFRRGAFQLADELGLPVVPVTIDGCFDVLPRQRGINFVSWHPLRLIIHAPIAPEGQGPENVQRTLEQSYEIIMNDLPKRHQDHSTAPNQ
jgi:1-acyl-sn-glycerol-3-phosphate acyltransferase